MVATLPFNRVAGHYETPEPELPKSARERGKLWSDTVFQAVLALKNQLRSPEAHIVAAAAESILELERTRMRHCRNLAGSEQISEAQEEFEEEQREHRADLRRNNEARAAAKREEEAASVQEKPAPQPEAKRAVSPALAEHAREARRVIEKLGDDMTEEESLQFTASLLRRLGRSAEEMPKETFRSILREMSKSMEAEKVAA